jgi:hypothetical protein
MLVLAGAALAVAAPLALVAVLRGGRRHQGVRGGRGCPRGSPSPPRCSATCARAGFLRTVRIGPAVEGSYTLSVHTPVPRMLARSLGRLRVNALEV